MPIREFYWDEWNREHVDRHGVSRVEVEEMRHNQPFIRLVKRGRYRLIGVTDAGRYLTVFADAGSYGLYYVVTARDATETERRYYRSRRTG